MIPFVPGVPLTSAQLREFDQDATERLHIPTLLLMENAARSVAELAFGLLLPSLRRSARAVALCGPGNNGGDGLAAARHLAVGGIEVVVVLSDSEVRRRPDAATNLDIWRRIGGRVLPAGAAETVERIAQADLILDGLLGTGAKGAPRPAMAELISAANAGKGKRVAIDVPSGLDADSGVVHEPCFRADLTVTLVASKPGFVTSEAQSVLGRVEIVGIGVPGPRSTG